MAKLPNWLVGVSGLLIGLLLGQFMGLDTPHTCPPPLDRETVQNAAEVDPWPALTTQAVPGHVGKAEPLAGAPMFNLPDKGDYQLYVTRVIDGDTVEVAYLVGPNGLRIAGINTPERGKEGYAEARYGLERYLGGPHRIAHFRLLGRDKYGRLLGDMESPVLGGWASEWMLKNGWAVPYDGKGPRP